VLLSTGTVAVWDGAFLLTVNLQSSVSSPIVAAEYLEVVSRDDANWIAANPKSPDASFHPAGDFDGKRFTANIPCSGRLANIITYYETSYFEYRFVVVHVLYQDGSERCVVAEVPVGRGNRSVTLVVP
jgi:hypothetical protein